MKKIITLLSAVVFSFTSQATLISVELDKDTYQQGETITADINVSNFNLDAFGFQELIGSFDINVDYDNSQVSVANVSFDQFLNGGNLIDSSQDTVNTGSFINIYEQSWLFDDLFFLQDGLPQFTLATISFNADMVGIGSIDLTPILLTDYVGNTITNFSVASDNYTISSAQAVPEPASALLMLPLAALVLLRRKNIRR